MSKNLKLFMYTKTKKELTEIIGIQIIASRNQF